MGSTTNLIANKTLYISCDCKSEVLVIEYDHEYKMADIAIYESRIGHIHKLSLWQRIRYCFQILVHKKPFTDQMMMNDKQLKDLKTFLNSLGL
jgi:hypothetical protein